VRRRDEILTSHHSKRSRLEILANILSFCAKEKKKTHIMYRANLSYRQLCTFIGFLTSMGLLTVVSDGKETFYRRTAEGTSFLRDFEKIESMLKKTNVPG